MKRRWPLAAVAPVALVMLGVGGAHHHGRGHHLQGRSGPARHSSVRALSGNRDSTQGGLGLVMHVRDAGTGRLLDEHFYSSALHKRTDYLIYLPPGYTRRRRYPVYYLLHGEPGGPLAYVDVADMDIRLDSLLIEGKARAMLLVYPDGRIDGDDRSDSEWANTPSGAYESAVIQTMQNVDQRFSTIPDRTGRVLAGYSMGAYGAINIGLHHLSEFASLQAWSGYYIETHTGVFAHASERTMAYDSPGRYITQLRPTVQRYPLQVTMFMGSLDDNEPEQTPMASALREAGAHASAHVYHGAHNWGLWLRHVNAMIDNASYDVAHPPEPINVPPGTRITPLPWGIQFARPVQPHP